MEGNLNTALNEMFRNFDNKEKRYSSICKVLSVDESARTCQLDPINGDAERKGRLQASVSLSEGVYIKPKVNSYVLLNFINKETGVIVQYSEIDSIEIKTDSGINIKQGNESITDLFEKQREIQDDVNALKDVIKNWAPVATDGGAALKTAASQWYSTELKIIE